MLSAAKSSLASSPAADSGDAQVAPISRFVAELHAFERMLRSTYAACGRVQVAAAEAHADQNLSIVAGHQILSAISAAQLSISEAMAQSAGGHRLLEALGRKMGYDVVAYGDSVKPPSGVDALRIIADVADVPVEA